MTSFLERHSLSRVEAGAAGDEAQFLYSYWRRNEGFIDQDSGLTYLSRKLMLFRPQLIAGDVPPVTMIGADTTFRRYLPPADEPTSLPKAYRSQCAPGYHAAIAGEPWYDIQRTGTMMGAGTPDLILERLILPFRTRGGFERLFCLLTLVEDFSRSGRSDPKDHPFRFRPGTGRYQSGWVHRPAIEQHFHAAG